MLKTVTINPEFEKLKGISPFWDNTHKSIQIAKSDYELGAELVRETNLADKIDNICYIICLLKDENDRLTTKKRLKLYKELWNSDLIEISNFIKIYNKDNRIAIYKIKLDYGIEKYNQTDEKYEYIRKGGIGIQHPEIIKSIIHTIWSKHKYSPIESKDLKNKIKQLLELNKPQTRRLELAEHLFKYFTCNTVLCKNERYYIIGLLFSISGLEDGLSKLDYEKDIKNKTSYKSYRDFVTSRIKNNYFKRGKKRLEK